MSLRHMHHCMSMNALEQGLLGPQEVHCPVKSPTRGTCKLCGKRTCWVCKGCGVHLHVKNCFLAHHGLA